MSQQSEERLSPSESGDEGVQTARILHMKSTQYDLQRAIQQRAQESVEREADLDREQRRPKPLKWLIITAIACIPMALTLVAVDGFLRAFHRYLDVAVSSSQNQPSDPAAAAPAAETTLQSNEPGVVLLQPITVPEVPVQAEAPENSKADSAATPAE